MEYDVDEILKIISDKHCRQIIHATTNDPKSAFEISTQCNIFLGTVYRKIQLLQQVGILTTHSRITDERKRSFTYQSKISGATIQYCDSKLKISTVVVEPNLNFTP